MTDALQDPTPASRIVVEATARDAAHRAAQRAGELIAAAIRDRGVARVIFASAPSQEAMLEHLAAHPGLDWSRVRSFHMDEYLGLAMDRPQAFGRWLVDRLPAAARPGFARIRTTSGVEEETARYGALVAEEPIDLTCLGIGVNGHIAFNEPGDADPADPAPVRTVTLDAVSRQQQVDDGLFPAFDEVPSTALTLTIPALMSARSMVCTVLGEHKAPAAERALRGPVSADCPASFLRRHRDVGWFLDAPAGSLLPAASLPSGS